MAGVGKELQETRHIWAEKGSDFHNDARTKRAIRTIMTSRARTSCVPARVTNYE